MEDIALVSICIPTYNGEKYLRECLESAISQTYKNIEILVVDDKSSDQTILIAKEFAREDNRIKVHVNKTNLGLVGNWNRSIELASGYWIKFLFQDDLLFPSCIARMLENATSETKFIFCNRKIIYQDDSESYIQKTDLNSRKSILATRFGIKSPGYISIDKMSNIISQMVYSNFMGEPNVTLFRKDITQKIGIFNPQFTQLCDLDYWLRIAAEYPLYYVPETLCSFRVHSDSTSALNNRSGKVLVDKIILSHELLNSSRYTNLRKHFSQRTLEKIFNMFKLKIYEVQKELVRNPDNFELATHYYSLKEILPGIAKYEKPSLKTRIISAAVNLRRKIKSKAKIF
jgi:glycosyltransferase involved in cell wall biosynthesis